MAATTQARPARSGLILAMLLAVASLGQTPYRTPVSMELARLEADLQSLSMIRDVGRLDGAMAGAGIEDPELALHIFAAAAREGLDPWLLAAVVAVESRGEPFARSARGALGPAQVRWAVWHADLPPELREANPYEKRSNVLAGARILRLKIGEAGSLWGGLDRYSGGARVYPEKVLRLAEELRLRYWKAR
jgi:hypothetical protein